MERCSICRKQVETVNKCQECGTKFCSECGNFKTGFCSDCKDYAVDEERAEEHDMTHELQDMEQEEIDREEVSSKD
jgi:hypothetical protein